MDDQPPLIWPQFESTGYTRRRSPIPTILVPAMIGVTSAAIFLLFITFVVPTFLSITSQILQPSSVKRGWDSINVVLVVFAILCGVLARRNDDASSSSSKSEEAVMISGEMSVGDGEVSKISSTSTVSSEHWFDDAYDADRLKIYESVSNRSFITPGLLPVTGTVPLRRSSTSYPDLRQGVFRETGDRRFRFYDDFEIDKYRSVNESEPFLNRSKTEIEEEPKEIHVDKFVVKPSSPPPSPPQQPPAPPPPPPPLTRQSPVEVSHKPRRTQRRNRDVQENVKRSETKFKRTFQPPPSPPPPPPPPPPPLVMATPPRKQGTLQRRKSNAAKEIKMVFASLYNQGKKKKKLQKSKRKEGIESSPVVVVVDDVMEEPPQYQSLIPPPSPPPPPPPPPPPRSSQSVFYGLFKKGVKSNKKIHSVPAPPPSPPPRKIQYDPQTPSPRRSKSGRPPRPTKPTSFNEENNRQGSPLIQITPPPPPPPPFRVPPLKFVVSGDFAKIRSNQSSRCSSPEREVFDIGWGLELTQTDGGAETTPAVSGGGGGVPGFCPSPDVNTKADNFIARLRDEWRLDKINSVNRKR